MIRRASLEDLHQLARLFDLYRQFYHQKSDFEAAKEFLKMRLEKKESVIFLASTREDSKNLMGFVQLYPTFSSVGLKTSWILNDLFVEPSARGKGLGEKLMTAAVTFSADSGARNLLLKTATTNEAAQKLYEKLGWVKEEKFYSYIYSH